MLNRRLFIDYSSPKDEDNMTLCYLFPRSAQSERKSTTRYGDESDFFYLGYINLNVALGINYSMFPLFALIARVYHFQLIVHDR